MTPPARDWGEELSELPSELLVRAAIAVVSSFLEEWKEGRPDDRQPVRAVEAAERLMTSPSDDLRAHARAIAKACTRSRKRSLGYEHRIAEAARAVALAAAATPGTRARTESAIEAIARCEEHRLYRFAVAGIYAKEAEVRAQLLELIRAAIPS